MSFSVLIRTHNRPFDLSLALDSVCNQKFLPKEIFVLDDLNQTSVKNLINQFKSKKKMNIDYINSQNQFNSLKNLNLIAEKSSSEYLAFLDDDDTWDPFYLSQNYKFLKSENIDILYTNFFRVYENEKFEFRIKKLKFKENILSNNGFIISNLIVRKKSFFELNGFDFSLTSSADKDFYLSALINKKNYNIKIQEEFLVNYKIFKKHNEWKWSDDNSKIFGAKLSFYKKYFLKISFLLHLKMIFQLLKFFKIYLKNFFS